MRCSAVMPAQRPVVVSINALRARRRANAAEPLFTTVRGGPARASFAPLKGKATPMIRSSTQRKCERYNNRLMLFALSRQNQDGGSPIMNFFRCLTPSILVFFFLVSGAFGRRALFRQPASARPARKVHNVNDVT